MEGSRFAVIAKDGDTPGLESIYEDIRECFLKGVELENVTHNLIAYGGMVASYSAGDGDEHALRDCLLHAYNDSKYNRHGDLVIYNGSHMDDPLLSEKIAMVAAVRSSMKEDFDGFYIMYQPIFGKKSSKPIGAEAFLKWRNEEYGDFALETFISEIEQDNEFNNLGYWMLKRVMRDGVDFLNASPGFFIYTDVMPAQVKDTYFKDNVKELAKDTGFPLSHLHIGLTRSCRLLSLDRLKEFLTSLHGLGIVAGLDSFARGNMWLKTYSLVEPDFVRFSSELTYDLKKGGRSLTILSQLAKMMDACDTEIYIKAVNDEGTKDFVSGLPVKGMQGDYFSKPVYYDEVIEYYDTEDSHN